MKIKIHAIGFNNGVVKTIFQVAARQAEQDLGQLVNVSIMKYRCVHFKCDAILLSPRHSGIASRNGLPTKIVDFSGCKTTEDMIKVIRYAIKDVSEEFLIAMHT